MVDDSPASKHSSWNASVICDDNEGSELVISDARVETAWCEIDTVSEARSLIVHASLGAVDVDEEEIEVLGRYSKYEDVTSLVEVLGTDGAYKELFAAVEAATDWSKQEVSSKLREELVCTRVSNDDNVVRFRCRIGTPPF